MRAYSKSNYQANRALHIEKAKKRSKISRVLMRKLIDGFKTGPCQDCNQEHPPWAMDFDHRDPLSKVDNVANLCDFGPDRIREEIAKCDLVCATCHRYRTHGGGITNPYKG